MSEIYRALSCVSRRKSTELRAAGVPGVQIFSGATKDYHRPSDTADKIDGPGLVKIASFFRESVAYLAEREDPLSFAGRKGESAKPATGGERKVTAGTMPDSPATGAGLKKGDIIVKLGTHEITDLKTYSAALKSFNPGDVVPLEYIREGEHKTTEIRLIAR